MSVDDNSDQSSPCQQPWKAGGFFWHHTDSLGSPYGRVICDSGNVCSSHNPKETTRDVSDKVYEEGLLFPWTGHPSPQHSSSLLQQQPSRLSQSKICTNLFFLGNNRVANVFGKMRPLFQCCLAKILGIIDIWVVS